MTTQEQRDKGNCIVAICTGCGRAVMLSRVLLMSRERQRDIVDAAAEGYDIKLMTSEKGRKLPFGCKCEPEEDK